MLVAALSGRLAAAQAPAPSAGDPSATLTALPTDLPTDGVATLSGLAYPEPGVQIRLTVTPPSGGPEVLLTTKRVHGCGPTRARVQ